MFRKKKTTNPITILDEGVERLKKKGEKASKLSEIHLRLMDLKFNEEGNFDYGVFKTEIDGRKIIKILRLFRVKSVSNIIRTMQSNEEAFKNILNNFSENGVSFVTYYSYKPGESLHICYGVVVEVPESEFANGVELTKREIGSLEDQFRAAYVNIEIEEIKESNEWVFDGFEYPRLTITKGIPKPDSSIGLKTGSTPYGNGPMAGRQVSEVLLKGVTAKRMGEKVVGTPFAMYVVFDRLDTAEIRRVLFSVENIMGKLGSSREVSTSENENFSFPMLFGFGFDAMMGESHQESLSSSDTQSVTNSESQSHTEGTGSSEQTGTSKGTSQGETQQRTDSESNTHSKGKSGGLGVSIANANFSSGDAAMTGQSSAEGQSQSITESENRSLGSTENRSDSSTSGKTNGSSHAMGTTSSSGQSEGKGHNTSLGGGVSGGDGSSLSRRQVDYFFDTILEIYDQYRKRAEHSLRDGMYDYRMFIMTPDSDAKARVDALIKQAYTDPNAPLPIRIEKLSTEEEKKLIKYARAFMKPNALENRSAIPDRYRYSTYITPNEATAFNLPQVNLPGYQSSFDPVPQSIVHAGKMNDGIFLGNQWYPDFNMESSDSFNIAINQLGHIGVFGGTGQGKTLFLQRFLSECHNRYNINIILFDWTKNHRSLLGVVDDKKKFRYSSFSKEFSPLKINLVATPEGVSEHKWNPILAELLCYSMGLGDRSFRIIKKILTRIKRQARERNIVPTMEHLAKGVKIEYDRRDEEYGGRMPFNEKETFSSMKERLEEWMDVDHPVYHCMCEGPYMSVDEMIKGDYLHLIECANLPTEVKQFVINGISASIFHYCASRDVKLKKPTYLIFEEAHSVLQMPTGREPLSLNETIFETMNREARNYNLFIGYVCQSPEKLPELIFDNLPIRVVFQLPDSKGKERIISAGGKDPLRMDVDLVKWISRQPRGICLVRVSTFDRLQDGEFVAVKVAPIPNDELSDSLFKTMLNNRHSKTINMR